MAKYTEQEMRHRADEEQYLWNDSTTAAMLRQAADMMEREEKRKRRPKKKYEYVVKYISCVGSHCKVSFNTLDEVNLFIRYSIASRKRIYRREVGKWEEVKE